MRLPYTISIMLPLLTGCCCCCLMASAHAFSSASAMSSDLGVFSIPKRRSTLPARPARPWTTTDHNKLPCWNFSLLTSLRGGGSLDASAGHGSSDKIISQDDDTTTTTSTSSRPTLSASSALLMASTISTWFWNLGAMYSSCLDARPILTKSWTAMVLFFASDQITQRMVEKTAANHVSYRRSTSSGLVGLLYFGPMAHYWYAFVFRQFPGPSVSSILSKAALGQVVFSPPLFGVFFAAALLQTGHFTLGNWISKIRRDLIPGMVGGLSFWPFVNYISYAYVPQKWIPLFVNLMGLVFNIYVSLVANRNQQHGGGAVASVAASKKAP